MYKYQVKVVTNNKSLSKHVAKNNKFCYLKDGLNLKMIFMIKIPSLLM